MNVECVKLAVDELLNQSAFSSDNNNCPIIYILLAISNTRLQVGILIPSLEKTCRPAQLLIYVRNIRRPI